MARTAEKRSRGKTSSTGEAASAEAIDIAVKDLIDNLIVPNLVEEFLRLYGPASMVKLDEFCDKSPQSQPDSELNSTP